MKTINEYAELVKAEHALNKTIAPVEDGANIAGSYTSGEQFIRDGVLYTALTTIATNTAWSSLTLDTDYKLADDITSQLASLNQTLTNQVKDMNNVYGSKNLAPNEAINATTTEITWIVNADKTVNAVVASTTEAERSIRILANKALDIPSGTYILNGNPGSDTRIVIYDNDASANIANLTTNGEVTFTYTSGHKVYITLYVNSSVSAQTLIFKPMIRLASIVDDTYEPYAKTNRELTEDTTALLDNLEVNGVVNLLPNHKVTVATNGVTFTANSDGTTSTSGAPTVDRGAEYNYINNDILSGAENGKAYKLTGCPSGGGTNTFMCYVYDLTLSAMLIRDIGNGAIFTYDSSHKYNIGIYVNKDVNVDGKTFKPMLSDPSLNLSYDDYVPYAKSNKELTEDVTPISNVLTRGTNVDSGGANFCQKVGKVVVFGFGGHTTAELAKNSVLATLPFAPTDGLQVIAFNPSTGTAFNINIDTNGNLKNTNHIIANDNYFIVNGTYVTS